MSNYKLFGRHNVELVDNCKIVTDYRAIAGRGELMDTHTDQLLVTSVKLAIQAKEHLKNLEYIIDVLLSIKNEEYFREIMPFHYKDEDLSSRQLSLARQKDMRLRWEEYCGSLDGAIETQDHYKGILKTIQKLVEKI